ncbi:MAG: hypothetical protein ACYC1U_01065 [Candidatus Aquicultorales bacterium]
MFSEAESSDLFRLRHPAPEVRWEPEIRGRIIAAYALVRNQASLLSTLVSAVEDRQLAEAFSRMALEAEAHAIELASLFDPSEGPFERTLAHHVAAVTTFVESAQRTGDARLSRVLDRLVVDHTFFADRFFSLHPRERLGYPEIAGGRSAARDWSFNEAVAVGSSGGAGARGSVRPKAVADISSAIALESLILDELRHVSRVFKPHEARVLCGWAALSSIRHLSLLEWLLKPNVTPLERAIPGQVAAVEGVRRAVRSTGDPEVEGALTLTLTWAKSALASLEHQFRKLEGRYPGRFTKARAEGAVTRSTADYLEEARLRLEKGGRAA